MSNTWLCPEHKDQFVDGCLKCTEVMLASDAAVKGAQRRTPHPSPEQAQAEKHLADYAIRAAAAAVHLAERAAQGAHEELKHMDGGTDSVRLANAEHFTKIATDATVLAERLDRIADKVFAR